MWLQAPTPLAVGHLQVAGSHGQVLGAMQVASVPCQAALHVIQSLIQAGLWGTFLHLIASICCSCKCQGCSMAGFICWSSGTSAFLSAML